MSAPDSLIDMLGGTFDDWSVQNGSLDEALREFNAEYDRLIEKARADAAEARTREIVREIKFAYQDCQPPFSYGRHFIKQTKDEIIALICREFPPAKESDHE